MFDTQNERAAALGFGLPFQITLPLADGTIGLDDAAHLLRSIQASVVAVVEPEAELPYGGGGYYPVPRRPRILPTFVPEPRLPVRGELAGTVSFRHLLRAEATIAGTVTGRAAGHVLTALHAEALAEVYGMVQGALSGQCPGKAYQMAATATQQVTVAGELAGTVRLPERLLEAVANVESEKDLLLALLLGGD